MFLFWIQAISLLKQIDYAAFNKYSSTKCLFYMLPLRDPTFSKQARNFFILTLCRWMSTLLWTATLPFFYFSASFLIADPLFREGICSPRTNFFSSRADPTKRAHDVKMTSYQRRCDVMTPHRYWYDVILAPNAHWVLCNPSGTWRRTDVVWTSMRRYHSHCIREMKNTAVISCWPLL